MFRYNDGPWTTELLDTLWELLRKGASLDEAAEQIGKGKGECDLALWSLVGYSPEVAAYLMLHRRAA